MPIELQDLFEFLRNVDWGWLVGPATAFGALALGWSRVVEFVDTWIIKTIPSGHRGYVMVLGNALRYGRPGKRGHLLVLPPFLYLQLFIVVKVERFSIQTKPLDSNEQTVRNIHDGRVYRIVGKAAVRYSKDGAHALISQIHVDNPEGVFHQMMQGAIAKIIAEATADVLSDYEQINKLVLEACDFVDACGIYMVNFRVATLAPIDAQVQRDGLSEIANSASVA